MESLLALEWLWQAWSAVSCSCPLLGGCQNLLQALRVMVETLLITVKDAEHSGRCKALCQIIIEPRNVQVTNRSGERLFKATRFLLSAKRVPRNVQVTNRSGERLTC